MINTHKTRKEYKQAVDKLNSVYHLKQVLEVVQDALEYHKQQNNKENVEWCEMAIEIINDRMKEIEG
jgi:hypothetical protein